MKILIISSFYGSSGGGAGLYVEYTADQLVKIGITPTIIVLNNPNQDAYKRKPPPFIKAIEPIQLYPLHTKDNQPIWKKILWQLVDIYNPYTAKQLKKIIEQEQPDLIHIHKMRGFSGAVWQVCEKLMPQKVIQTLQDYESISPLGTLEGQIGKWAEKGHFLLQPYQILRRIHSKKISWVTAPSQYTLNAVLAHGVFSNAQSQVIPNPHCWDLEQLNTRKQIHILSKRKMNSPITFLYLGRLEPEKGIYELLLAFSNIAKKYNNVKLVVAGWGTMEKKLKQAWGRHSSIQFLGKVEKEQKEKLLAEIDIMVVPSTWPEVFGIVSVEALAFGKAVIASNAGGLPEIIIENKNGWLFEPGNLQVLQDRLEYVIQNPGILDKMAAACYETAKKYAVDVITQQYLDLYERVLSSQS